MKYAIKLTTEATEEPITLDAAKEHLRVPTSDEDANIAGIYIPAARQRIEAELGRCLITSTFRLNLDSFPAGTCPIMVPVNPVQSITSIQYITSEGTQTIAASDYVVNTDTEPCEIHPTWGSIWPTVLKRTESANVSVEFVAGYGASGASVPAAIRQAMLLLVGHYYYHRESVTMGSASILPEGVANLLAAYNYGDEFTDYGGRH